MKKSVGDQGALGESSNEQGVLGQTSEEVSGGQGALGAPSEDVSVSGTRVKRRAASACKQKMHQWCAQLNQ